MFEAEGNFIIYDKQGPLGSIIKQSLKKTNINVFRCKKILNIADALKKKSEVKFLFILFVYNEEYELIDCIALAKFNIPIVFAPIDKNSYESLKRVNGIEVMDVSTSKIEYVSQIVDFLKL
ncbi:hypothetical protein [Ulvibacterium sp.]|uniref:hypothetical protein n=1 Tax=Ulvibacterium sp. TaxID=2665914 RepID=UPI0026269F64|nr:hypothetical protein [Ulvibacterium sp.]